MQRFNEHNNDYQALKEEIIKEESDSDEPVRKPRGRRGPNRKKVVSDDEDE